MVSPSDPAHLSDYSPPPAPLEVRLLPHGLRSCHLRTSFQFICCLSEGEELSCGGVRRAGQRWRAALFSVEYSATMDQSLFGCLRSPHAPTQGLHPAINQSPLALHHRSNHTFMELPGSSPSYGYSGEESGGFGSSEQHKHPQNTPSWPGPLHSICVPPPEAPELRSGSPNQRGTSVQTSDRTGTTCSSCEEPHRKSITGKSESSGTVTVHPPISISLQRWSR